MSKRRGRKSLPPSPRQIPSPNPSSVENPYARSGAPSSIGGHPYGESGYETENIAYNLRCQIFMKKCLLFSQIVVVVYTSVGLNSVHGFRIFGVFIFWFW